MVSPGAGLRSISMLLGGRERHNTRKLVGLELDQNINYIRSIRSARMPGFV